jgi:hypothetical protein
MGARSPIRPPPSGLRREIPQTDIPTVRKKKRYPQVAPRPDPALIDRHGTMAAQSVDRAPRVRARAGRARTILGFVGVGAAMAMVGALVALRARGTAAEARLPTTTATLTTSIAPAPTVSWTALTAPGPSSAAPSAPGTSKVAPPIATVAPSAPGSAVTASGKAPVTLLGDPGTHVWIDGTSRGDCPARVSLDPGPHEVRFTFDPTGESRVERFTVRSGDPVTVRADFTGATPTVKIQR